MKIKVLITTCIAIIISLSFNNSVFASGWTEQTSAGNRYWIGLASSSDGTKIAAGDYSNGYIYTSTDSGATWTQRTGAGTGYWISIGSSSDGTKLIAADFVGTYLYTSTDSGATWTQRTSAGSRTWRSVASSSDGTNLVAVALTGYIYTSTDSGVTWTERVTSGSRDWIGVASSSDGTNLVAVVNDGYIYNSVDSGATWTQRTSAGSRTWRSVASSSDGTNLVAVGYNGYVYTSTDRAVTWTEQTGSPTGVKLSVASSSDGTKLAVTVNNGYIYTSTDSGVTWTAQTDAGSRVWWSVTSSSDGTKLVAVMSPGSIYTYSSADTTPPTITSVTPIDGAVDQASDTSVVINFSEPMDTTVSEAEVAFSPCTSCSLTSAWSNSDQTLTLTKASGTFTAGQTYTFTVTAPVDVAGNPMAEPYVWSFTILANATNNNYQFPPLCTSQFTPSTITKGDPTTLSWNISWQIDEPHKKSTYYVKVPTMGIFGPNEPKAILYPTHTTTYRIASINLFGANFCDATITVLDTDGTEIVSTQNSYLTANSIRSPLGSMIVDFLKRLFKFKS